MNKIFEFVKRNRKRNNHLWENDKKEGIDYIICPITKTRLSMLKKNYIEKTLNIQYDIFKEKYPNQKMICNKRYENIKNGLKKIDNKTGLTKHQLSCKKRYDKLSKIGEDGLTGFQRYTRKTKETHLNKIDENGLNGYQRIAKIARPKQIDYNKKCGRISKCAGETIWIIFRKYIVFLTSRFKKQLYKPMDDIRLSIDHMFSICSGFNNGVSPFVLASLHNLEYIEYKQNISKQANCSITLKQLYKSCNYTPEKSKYEYDITIDVINEFIRNDEYQSMLDIDNEIRRKLNETKLY